MTDRFDYLEFGDAPPVAPPSDAGDADSQGPTGPASWKPLALRAVEVIGEQGRGAGQFSSPGGIATDRTGALYVADTGNHRVQRIDTDGGVLVYGTPGRAVGQIWGPHSVAVSLSGDFLYVSEQGSGRVQCFEVKTGNSRGALNGLKSPAGLAFDADGMLWIAETGNGRVLRMDPAAGRYTSVLDASAGLKRPVALCADSSRNLYVVDEALADIIGFTLLGQRGFAFSEVRSLSQPRAVAMDAMGRIYLAEAGANRLHVFDGRGQSLITFDTPSTRLGTVMAPSGVALAPDGAIYLSDTGNHRILRLAWD